VNVLNVSSRPVIHLLRDTKRSGLIFSFSLRILLRARSRAARKQRARHSRLQGYIGGWREWPTSRLLAYPERWQGPSYMYSAGCMASPPPPPLSQACHGDCRSALELPATPFSHFWAKHAWIPRVQILALLGTATPVRNSLSSFLSRWPGDWNARRFSGQPQLTMQQRDGGTLRLVHNCQDASRSYCP
jgi:hypothetical protein